MSYIYSLSTTAITLNASQVHVYRLGFNSKENNMTAMLQKPNTIYLPAAEVTLTTMSGFASFSFRKKYFPDEGQLGLSL